MSRKYALITGSTSGIGSEFSKILLKSYNLVIVGSNQNRLDEFKYSLMDLCPSDLDINIEKICVDLSVTNSTNVIFDYCKKKSLRVDVLVNNAGIGCFGEHTDIEDSEITRMLNLNVLTLTLMCKYFGNQMKNNRCGYILNVSSLAAYQPVPNIAAYAASKSYVLHFSEALSKELEDYGVSVTCLSPGHTRTNFFKRAGIGDRKEGFYGLKTRMSPIKVAELGIKALFCKKLSVIPGLKNNFIANINRFCTRSFTAKISKMLTKNP